jgi:hypothetical protein
MLLLRSLMPILCCWLFLSTASPAQEAVRRASTCLGGGGREFSNAVAVDREGNVLIAGWTDSSDFPVPDGWEVPAIVGGTDALVAKLSPDLKTILAVTTLGGWGDDWAMGIGVIPDGSIMIAGWASVGFPTTEDAFQPENAGDTDIFVASLTPDLELIYSTFLGGSGKEEAWHARVDETGVVTVVGFTQSGADFPRTEGCFQPAFGGGPNDAFVAQIRPDGALPAAEQLAYSTFLGGRGDEYLEVHDAGLSADGRLAVFINTSSPDLPVVFGGAYRGGFDAYVAVLDPALEGSGQLLYSTYLGGRSDDTSGAMRWLDDHTLALTGWTQSTDFPRTDASAHQGENDVFLSVLDLEKPAPVFSTLIGGSLFDRPKEMVVSSDGSLLILGATSSGNFPAIHALSPFVHDNDQPFLLAFRWRGDDPPASRLWFSSSLGGRSGSAGNDYARGIALHPSGLHTVTGLTGAPDFPTTTGVVQPSHAGGGRDAFVALLDLRFPAASFVLESDERTMTIEVDGKASTPGRGPDIVSHWWDFGDRTSAEGATATHEYAAPGRYAVTLTVANEMGLTDSETRTAAFGCPSGSVAPWMAADIGGPLLAGATERSTGPGGECFHICAGGKAIGGTMDSFHFVHRDSPGNDSLVARIDSVAGPSLASTGLMIRQGLESDSPFGSIHFRGNGRVSFLARARSGAAAGSFRTTGESTQVPVWIRLDRASSPGDDARSEITGLYSTVDAPAEDDWIELGTATVEIPAGPGLAGVAGFGADTGAAPYHPLQASVCLVTPRAPQPQFLRGDANADGIVDLSDAVFALGALFLGTRLPACFSSADFDDSGRLDVTDPIFLLGTLFLGTGAVPAPAGDCGIDPTPDGLTCESSPPCEHE